MIFVKDTLCFIIFYSIISYLSFGDVNGKHIPKNNAMVGKLKNEKILTPRSELSSPQEPSPRSDYSKPNSFYDRGIYDYSTPFDSIYNNFNNYPQSSVSFYPFSLQDVDYLYPKLFNRFYPYNSNNIPRHFQSPLDYPAEENQIPLYRDAQYYEPASELQLIKHLIPIGYSTHLVTPRESVSTPNYFGSSVPYPRQLPLQSAAIGSSDFNKLGVLLKAMEIAADESPNSPAPSMNIRQKVETVARLLILAPSFADEIFKCLSQSEAANKFIQTAQNFSNRSEEPTTTS